MGLKNYSPNYGRKFLKFGEKHIKRHIQEAEQTSNRIKPKKYKTGYIIVKFLKINNKGNVLRAVREKRSVSCRRKSNSNEWGVSHQKPSRPEASGTFSKYWKERTVKISFRKKGKSRFSNEGKPWEYVTSRPSIKEWLLISLNTKKMIKEGIWEHQEEKTERAKAWVNKIDFPSPSSFLNSDRQSRTCSDVYLMQFSMYVEAIKRSLYFTQTTKISTPRLKSYVCITPKQSLKKAIYKTMYKKAPWRSNWDLSSHP